MLRSLLILSAVSSAHAENVLELKLRDVESRVLSASNQLKAYASDEEAAGEEADARFTGLLPKLAAQATYQYYGAIPQISIGPLTVPFGTNSTYFLGPTLSYTLWDTFSGRRAYQAASLLKDSRSEDRKGERLQLLTSVRAAYVQVQLGLEELRLIFDTLQLSRAQKRDVANRLGAGAATQLDMVTADKSVGTYEIQFKQRQADLSSDVQQLLSLIGTPDVGDLSHPGPPGVESVSLVLNFDALDQSIAQDDERAIAAPGDDHPQVKSLELQAQSSDRAAQSQWAKLIPQLQVSGGVSYNLPNIPNPSPYWQQTVAATLSVPLYVGDPTPHLAAEQRSLARAAEFRRAQLKEDIHRDYEKAKNLLASLRDQKQLALANTVLADKAAKLYYFSYRAGKVNLIDVQNANVQALQSKVDSARIDAQILNQLISLKSLSGKEEPRG